MGSLTVDDVLAMGVERLHTMSQQEVAGLSPAARSARRDRLRRDETLWNITRVAKEFPVRNRNAVAKWRNRYLATGHASRSALPPPDVPHDNVRQPGADPDDRRTGSPTWYGGTLREWGFLTERLDEDFFPIPGGPKPTGRPPRQRDGSVMDLLNRVRGMTEPEIAEWLAGLTRGELARLPVPVLFSLPWSMRVRRMELLAPDSVPA